MPWQCTHLFSCDYNKTRRKDVTATHATLLLRKGIPVGMITGEDLGQRPEPLNLPSTHLLTRVGVVLEGTRRLRTSLNALCERLTSNLFGHVWKKQTNTQTNKTKEGTYRWSDPRLSIWCTPRRPPEERWRTAARLAPRLPSPGGGKKQT